MNPDINNTMPLPSGGGKPQSTTLPVMNPEVLASGSRSQPTSPDLTKPAHVETEAEFEKKWVAAAKTIVAQTKHDPHLQSKELSRVGAEYRKEIRARG